MVSSAPAVASSAPVVRPPPAGGVSTWETPESHKDCPLRGREVDLNLAHGALSLGSRGKEMAVIRLLRSGTRGEGQIAIGASDCADEAIARYLVDGVPPPAGTRC